MRILNRDSAGGFAAMWMQVFEVSRHAVLVTARPDSAMTGRLASSENDGEAGGAYESMESVGNEPAVPVQGAALSPYWEDKPRGCVCSGYPAGIVRFFGIGCVEARHWLPQRRRDGGATVNVSSTGLLRLLPRPGPGAAVGGGGGVSWGRRGRELRARVARLFRPTPALPKPFRRRGRP